MLKTLTRRREFLSGSAALSAGLIATTTVNEFATASSEDAVEIIDCHTHFYDPTRPQGVPWPNKTSKIYRKVLPADFRKIKKQIPVSGTVIVEASKWVADNQWLLDLAKDDPFIKGIVGRLDPMNDEFEKQLKRFAANDLYRGIRVNFRVLEKLVAEKRLKSLNQLADLDLELDVNGTPEMLVVIEKAAKLVPKLRILVNHLANANMATNQPAADWIKGMQSVAKMPNTFCKVSGLVSSAGRGGRKPPEDPSYYEKYLETVWQAFGEDRLIYGSDWPVSSLFANYVTVQKLVMPFFRAKGTTALKKFCSGNALRAYKYLPRKQSP